MRPVSFGREVASVVMKAVVLVVTIVGLVVSISWLYESESNISDGTCNVAVFPIEGMILPFHGLVEVPLTITPEAVNSFISSAESEPAIEAVLVEINSPGGTPVASERIAERLKNSKKPVVGLIGDVAASGGYMVASAAEHLVASPMSDVGSIGVNMSYVEESLKNEEEGLTYVQLVTGKFKDAGSPNRTITEEERELFQRDLDIVHDAFVKIVAENRSLPISVVENLADGSTMAGKLALDNRLVDSLGGIAEAKRVLAERLGTDVENIVLCEYQSPVLPF